MSSTLVPPSVRLTSSKFDATGRARPFPGNTIIWHLPPTSAAHRALVQAQAALARGPAGRWMALLPPPSFHLTLVEGCLDQVRTPRAWPRDLSPAAPLDEVHAFMAERLRTFDLACELPLRLTFGQPEISPLAARFSMAPRDKHEEHKLFDLRERLAEALGLWHEDHVGYGLHVTVAYIVGALNMAEQREFEQSYEALSRDLQKADVTLELREPEFCVFADMTHYEKKFLLKNQGSATHREHAGG